MRDARTTVVKVSSTADILGVIPHRVGFAPQESLVVVSLHGPRRRDELVMRFDLAASRHDAAFGDEVVGRLRHRGADATVLVCYSEAPEPAVGLLRAPLMRSLRRDLRRAGIEVVDALLVREGRWWSYLCHDETCCPAQGTPVPAEPTPAASHYAAETVAAGSVLLPDRAALVASVEHQPDPAWEQAWEEIGDRMVALLISCGGEVLRKVTCRSAEAVVERWSLGDRAVGVDDGVVLCLGLRSKSARDRVMTMVLDHDPAVLAALFAELARRTPDADAAPVCAVLAWAASAAGSGALAGVAAERALRVEPGYTMAELVLEGLDRMVPPADIREIAAAVRDELAAEDAAVGDDIDIDVGVDDEFDNELDGLERRDEDTGEWEAS